MSREIRKTGVLAMVVMLAATLSGCRLAKKDEDGTVKKTLYGDYAVVGKRPVDMDSNEKDYIQNDSFHYINTDNIIWLCVDQIQKLKKRVKELEEMKEIKE